jgi:hypothetical protein
LREWRIRMKNILLASLIVLAGAVLAFSTRFTDNGIATGNPVLELDNGANGGVRISSASAYPGMTFSGIYGTTVALDWGATSANSCDSFTPLITGVINGSPCFVGTDDSAVLDTDGILQAFGTADNTVTVRRCNLTGGALANPDPANHKIICFKVAM